MMQINAKIVCVIYLVYCIILMLIHRPLGREAVIKLVIFNRTSNIGVGSGWVPSGNKPLPEQIFTYSYDTIRRF